MTNNICGCSDCKGKIPPRTWENTGHQLVTWGDVIKVFMPAPKKMTWGDPVKIVTLVPRHKEGEFTDGA